MKPVRTIQLIKNLNFNSPKISGEKIFHHLKPYHLDRFEIEAVIKHKFKRLIIFDACQFDFSADSYLENYGTIRRFTRFTKFRNL